MEMTEGYVKKGKIYVKTEPWLDWQGSIRISGYSHIWKCEAKKKQIVYVIFSLSFIWFICFGTGSQVAPAAHKFTM